MPLQVKAVPVETFYIQTAKRKEITMKNTKIMDIVCDILEDQQQNSIDCYEFNGIDLTLTESIRMQSTILLTLFRPCSFVDTCRLYPMAFGCCSHSKSI